MTKVKKGSRVFYSEKGHKGFHYPSNDNSYLITEEVEVRTLNWVFSKEDDRVPVTISLPDDPAKVVWIRKVDLLD